MQIYPTKQGDDGRGGLAGSGWIKAPPCGTLSVCLIALIRWEPGPLRRPPRRRSPPGRAGNPPETEAEAAFLAGAALARLDAVVRENPPWCDVWRQRLALTTAAAGVARAGRGEDATALRDAFHLTRPGADPGPAGRRLLAWRALTAASSRQWRSQIERAAEVLKVPRDEALQAAIKACADGHGLAPFAAARAHQLARAALTAGKMGAGGWSFLRRGSPTRCSR